MLARLAPALLLLAFAPAMAQDRHVARIGTITVLHVWTRATTDPARPADVFLEVENAGAADSLIAASSPDAGRASIVGLQRRDTTIVAQPIGSADVPARRKLRLDPNGIAIRLEELKRPLPKGADFSLLLTFAKAGVVAVSGETMAANARQHSHAGHSH